MVSSERKVLRFAIAAVSVSMLLVALVVMVPSVFAAQTCLNDTDGANDEPGQKDLTKICTDYAGYPASLKIEWNWDEVGTSGANSLDACSLFDTDGDGNANLAVCVETTGNPATLDTTSVLTCDNTRPDRCSGYAPHPTPPPATCTVTSPSADDPFDASAPNGPGDEYPDDAKASCDIDLSGLDTNAVLLDVCSYPSNPNSDPSDCVARTTGNQLIVRKITDPGDSTQLFDFSLSTGDTFQLGSGGIYATAQDLEDGSYTISETPVSGWLTSIACDDGTTVESGTSVEVTLDGAPVACTFTNVLATGNIVVRKVANPIGTTAIFPFDPSWSDTNFNLSEGSLPFKMAQDSGPLPAGTYTVQELVPGNWKLTNLVCEDPDGGSTVDRTTATATIDLDSDETVTCTFTDTKNGRIKVVKEIPLKNYTGTQKFEFDPSWSETNFFLSKSQVYDTLYTLPPGVYSVAEVNIPAGWRLDKSSCNDGSPVSAIDLSAGETVICKFANLPQ